MYWDRPFGNLTDGSLRLLAQNHGAALDLLLQNCRFPISPSPRSTGIPRFQSLHVALNSPMKLEQGQVWKRESDYLRIVRWERLAIEYKQMTDLRTKEGTSHEVTKKEFCRLIKNATLLDPAQER